LGREGCFTFVRKSLQPAANASCLSLCRLLAVKATMMTGLLNISLLPSLSPSSREPASLTTSGALLLALLLNTPIPFSFSRRRISRVACRPFMTGS
jgi:hypothetical protein